jgi:subtilase family serine protease
MRANAVSPDSVVHAPGQTNCGPSGNVCYYFPKDLYTAYATNFIANSNGGQGMTVAIVDAYYNSQTESDLATYVNFINSQAPPTPLPACTIANGCLTIVNQIGGPPTGIGFDAGWAQETNLDVQTVHAIAPNAKILLVACNSNSDSDLFTGVLYARAHSNVVSNSYGGGEDSSQLAIDTTYLQGTPVPLLFSSGDTGAEIEYPCSSPYGVCVGGSHLLTTSTVFRNVESAWGDGVAGDDGAGGGCSLFSTAPAYTTGFNTCAGGARGVPDIGALADPYTGFLVYLGDNASGGAASVYVFGGTSLAAPLMSAYIALVDTARAAVSKAPLGGNLNQLLYQAAGNPYYRYRYYDVATGSTGFPAVSGWDRTNGLGVPLLPSLASYLVSLP